MFFDSTPINKALFNSARGTIIGEARDETFSLLVTKDVLTNLDFETKRKYITVACILSEASQKLLFNFPKRVVDIIFLTLS